MSSAGQGNEASGPRAVLTRPAPPPDVVLRYGDDVDQVADVRVPPNVPVSASGVTAPLVIFLHGGFWRAGYDRSHTGPLATALAAAGFTVCVPEFRRVGPDGGGWPSTFDDVAAAVDVLPRMTAAATDHVDPARLILAGHSAGGHLALWAAARHRLPAGTPWHTVGPRPVRAVVGLAAVSDLTACHDDGLGDAAAAALMGGSPRQWPERYARTDPARLLPLGVPVWLLHGADDDRVPVAMSRSFAAQARAAGDAVVLRELAGCEHFGLIDPLSPAWRHVQAAFTEAMRL